MEYIAATKAFKYDLSFLASIKGDDLSTEKVSVPPQEQNPTSRAGK